MFSYDHFPSTVTKELVAAPPKSFFSDSSSTLRSPRSPKSFFQISFPLTHRTFEEKASKINLQEILSEITKVSSEKTPIAAQLQPNPLTPLNSEFLARNAAENLSKTSDFLEQEEIFRSQQQERLAYLAQQGAQLHYQFSLEYATLEQLYLTPRETEVAPYSAQRQLLQKIASLSNKTFLLLHYGEERGKVAYQELQELYKLSQPTLASDHTPSLLREEICAAEAQNITLTLAQANNWFESAISERLAPGVWNAYFEKNDALLALLQEIQRNFIKALQENIFSEPEMVEPETISSREPSLLIKKSSSFPKSHDDDDTWEILLNQQDNSLQQSIEKEFHLIYQTHQGTHYLKQYFEKETHWQQILLEDDQESTHLLKQTLEAYQEVETAHLVMLQSLLKEAFAQKGNISSLSVEEKTAFVGQIKAATLRAREIGNIFHDTMQSRYAFNWGHYRANKPPGLSYLPVTQPRAPFSKSQQIIFSSKRGANTPFFPLDNWHRLLEKNCTIQ